MTVEKAINILEGIRTSYICDPNECKLDAYDATKLSCKMCDEGHDALAIAISALKKAEKYKWHDLRKNPDDLPREAGFYFVNLVKRITDRWMYYEYAVFVFEENFWKEQSVIAWREIESFEEE